jgi:single-stranded-DNA-specific exonuclease
VTVALEYTPDVIVTVDNGIASLEGVAAARSHNISVLVTDHHLPGAVLPDANVIVNPNQPGCSFPSKNLAGVGVIFYVMSQLRKELRLRGWFEDRSIPEPNMGGYLDLVALGTVADVVPLDSHNRILVAQGLARIRAGKTRPGILALLDLAGREQHRVEASDLGFAVGPRLNAAGRLDDMSTGIECLLTTDTDAAFALAGQLDSMNRERRQIEAEMQRSAMSALESVGDLDRGALPTGICLYDPSWHQGVIGILAARVKERFHRPVIAFADGDQGWLKGSARSIPGFHIRDALDAIATRSPDMLSRFGGHAMAAGLSLKVEDLERFGTEFEAEAVRGTDPETLQAVLYTDGELHSTDLTLEFAELLRAVGPWGQQFPEPMFEGTFELVQQRLVGEKHLKMLLSMDSTVIDAIAFNVDTDVWPASDITRVYLCFKLNVNTFRGRTTLQLMVEHLAPQAT